ncbi:MAG: FtsQ-type POTRA domain-containing protein [Cyanobacteria bacterium P01_E01_bin.6]
MTDLTVSSRAALQERRRRLRWQKRWKLAKLLWRTVCVSSLTGGLLWVVAESNWIIRSPQQIHVEGMNLLSEETVRSLIPMAYPELIFDVDPGEIERQLQAHGPIDTVAVDRQLFPPSLSVYITERRPVAVLLGDTYTNPFETEITPSASWRPVPSKVAPTGLLDESGSWLPITSYTHVRDDVELPTLTVIGMQASYRQAWRTLYTIVRSSPIEISEIDWQHPGNLIFNTELGIVHIGPYPDSHLQEKLILLDQLRDLPKRINLEHIAYIDLTHVASPMLQFKPTAPQYNQTILQVPVPLQDEQLDDVLPE